MQRRTILELLKRSIEHYPNHIAVHGPDRQIDYADLDQQSDRLASSLIQKNVIPGDLVPIIGHRSIELVIAQLAVMKTGASYVPIDARQPDLRKHNIIEQCSSGFALVTDDEYATRLCLPAFSIDALLATSSASPLLAPQPCDRDVVYVIFTSGTTGEPKGVVIEHRALYTVVEWHNARFAMKPDCRTTLMAGVGFDVSQWEIWSTLAAGACLFLLPEDTRLCVPDLLTFYCEHRITHAYVPTILISELIRHPANRNLALRYLFTAGEKLPPVETRHLPYRLVDYYGPTEATIYATCRIFDDPRADTVASIGFPIADTQIYLLDEQLNRVPAGDIGEIFITGPCLARGYLNRPELTAERFINLVALDQRAYRTGDLGRVLPDNSIQYLGRNDDQVKVRGYRIELAEVEVALLKHPQVVTAVVLVDDAEGPAGDRLVAFIIPADGATAELVGSIKTHMKLAVPDYMLPSRYLLLDSIPQTPNGKTDKSALRAQLGSAQTRADDIKVENEAQRVIASVWRQHLRHTDFTTNDSFFEAGGNSLMAAAILKDIAQRLRVRAYIRDIYQSPTIRALANRLEQRRSSHLHVSESEPVLVLQNEVSLPTPFDPVDDFDERQLTSPTHILLTGACGFVGVHLLQTLLSSSTAHVHCPIRAGSPVQARQRMMATFEHYKIRLAPDELARIHTYPGDLSEPSIGLAQEVYEHLCREVELIYHSASAVNFIQPYSYMKKDNVEGLKRVIEFAVRTRLKPLILLSTISVYSWGHLFTGRPTMREDDDIDQNLPAVLTDLGYVRSKWVMEKIADLAASRGLPLMTFRLGYATCHSKSGEFARYQWWSGLVRTCMALNAIPDLENLREGLTTVDYMTSAIAHISRNPLALGKKFNLIPSPEKNLTLQDFFQRLGEHLDLQFEKIPFRDWVALWSGNQMAPLYPLSSLFTDSIVDGKSTVELYQNTYLWDCSNVRHFLQDSDIQEPEFDDRLISRYLKKIQEMSSPT